MPGLESGSSPGSLRRWACAVGGFAQYCPAVSAHLAPVAQRNCSKVAGAVSAARRSCWRAKVCIPPARAGRFMFCASRTAGPIAPSVRRRGIASATTPGRAPPSAPSQRARRWGPPPPHGTGHLRRGAPPARPPRGGRPPPGGGGRGGGGGPAGRPPVSCVALAAAVPLATSAEWPDPGLLRFTTYGERAAVELRDGGTQPG